MLNIEEGANVADPLLPLLLSIWLKSSRDQAFLLGLNGKHPLFNAKRQTRKINKILVQFYF